MTYKKYLFEAITTRGGDEGLSTLYNGERRPKDDPIFCVLGDLDELNSFLGWVKSSKEASAILRERIETLQRALFRVGAMVATPPTDPLFASLDKITDQDLFQLEALEHRVLESVEIPERFVLPGSTSLSAQLDICRTICRRAERSLVTLIRQRGIQELFPCQRYINRMSDYLYLLARWAEGEKEREKT
ncbi:MAG: cob(I)yrinic acid a,c-diamide adenosyltransferase [Spirochaetales bacterium]